MSGRERHKAIILITNTHTIILAYVLNIISSLQSLQQQLIKEKSQGRIIKPLKL